MRFRLPKDCTGVTHAGESLLVGADRIVVADEAAAVELAAHGLQPIVEKPSGDRASGVVPDDPRRGPPR